MDFLLSHTMLERFADKPEQTFAQKWAAMTGPDRLALVIQLILETMLGVVAARMSLACTPGAPAFIKILIAVTAFAFYRLVIIYHVLFASSKCAAYWA